MKCQAYESMKGGEIALGTRMMPIIVIVALHTYSSASVCVFITDKHYSELAKTTSPHTSASILCLWSDWTHHRSYLFGSIDLLWDEELRNLITQRIFVIKFCGCYVKCFSVLQVMNWV